MRLTTSQNALNFGLRRSPDPLVGRGFLPSAIESSRLRRMQFPRLTCSYVKNSNISPSLEPTHLAPTALRFFLFQNVPLLEIPSNMPCPASFTKSLLVQRIGYAYFRPIQSARILSHLKETLSRILYFKN